MHLLAKVTETVEEAAANEVAAEAVAMTSEADAQATERARLEKKALKLLIENLWNRT